MGQHRRVGRDCWLQCLDAAMLRDIVEESCHLSTVAEAMRRRLVPAQVAGGAEVGSSKRCPRTSASGKTDDGATVTMTTRSRSKAAKAAAKGL